MPALLFIALGVAATEPRHLRLETDAGAVHVFSPRGYERRTAGIVFYVHGYYDDVDQAWAEHQLQRQFEASGVNALFVAVEAPTRDGDEVRWPSQRALEATLEAFGVVLPSGRKAVVAHSGGFRTARAWLDEGQLDHVVLLDGLYASEAAFAAWASARDAAARLVLVAGAATRERTEQLVSSRDDVAALDTHQAPPPGARIAVVRSEVGHMEMVTEGAVIPAVLKWLRLEPLERRATFPRAARRPNLPAAGRR